MSNLSGSLDFVAAGLEHANARTISLHLDTHAISLAGGDAQRPAARQQAISQQIRTACDRFSELGVCHRLNQLIQGQLFVGNSMPARLMDMLGEVGKGPSRVMTNRGASGIDGLIATAYGFAQSVQPGSNEPTTLLLDRKSVV